MLSPRSESGRLDDDHSYGPLTGVKIVELAGVGPGPLAAMILADLGAEVVRVDRLGATPVIRREFEVHGRSRRSISVDLKKEAGRALLFKLVERSDALIEGMRPGAVERLGVGPDECLSVNPKLVYARMTGWGQDGPYSGMAGHDINYLAVTGGLHAIGRRGEPPVPPLNLVADFGGGGMFLAVGVVSGILRSRLTGVGDVVDAAMVDGVNSLLSMFRGFLADGMWEDRRESNLLDGGAPFYRCYECADGKYVAIGANEEKFWRQLLDAIGLADDPLMGEREDKSAWAAIADRLAVQFRTRPRDEWVAMTEGTDSCLSPVLSFVEARDDAHLKARDSFVDVDGVTHAAPAPRFQRAGCRPPLAPAAIGADTSAILEELGFDPGSAQRLRRDGVVG
ncbi:CaiB/BaiF CoA transferase family protein [Brevibacterium sp. VCM10]|uniref:CaiB/BaiF CoA transferase family protein n=1 Tax=Brevibacterium sp. VCM10 TaxID=1381751 RepID=UPI001E30F3C5|nr:CaiB/BaiF CoA-transferase family protein [Brevibacterium sp. VCM10]